MLNAYDIHTRENAAGLPDGRYVPARPEIGFGGFLGLHWRDAFLVLIGRRHAVYFPGQEPDDRHKEVLS